MKKKVLLAAVGLLSTVVLAACSGGSNADIATMKGGKITVEDFYDEAKKESTNQTLVRNMIIYKVFENAYGDEVSDKAVDKEYKSQEKQYGSTFESQLKSAGYTKSTYKDYLRQSLAFQKGLNANVKLTDKDLKTAWESFHPEVTARIIKVSSEDDANEIKAAVDGGADFAEEAKSKSEDTTTAEDGGKIKFDSQSTTVPDEVKTAAFSLENDQVSDVISSTDSSTYSTSYYIVKMEKQSSKGNDMDKYKKELRKIARATKTSDSTFTTKVIRKELKKANVKIEDDGFSSVLSDFLETSSSTSESSSKKKSSATSESESSTAESTTESSTATSESTAATDSSAAE